MRYALAVVLISHVEQASTRTLGVSPALKLGLFPVHLFVAHAQC